MVDSLCLYGFIILCDKQNRKAGHCCVTHLYRNLLFIFFLTPKVFLYNIPTLTKELNLNSG